MKENKLHTLEIAEQYNITSCGVRFRAKQLGIKSIQKGHQYWYTEKEADQIGSYKRKKSEKRIAPKDMFTVIELFLWMDNNTCKNISEASGVPIQTVSYIIDDYLKNDKTIVVSSKMHLIE